VAAISNRISNSDDILPCKSKNATIQQLIHAATTTSINDDSILSANNNTANKIIVHMYYLPLPRRPLQLLFFRQYYMNLSNLYASFVTSLRISHVDPHK
jgi:hypothetical protein